jgi:Ser/Thr protein kinase RdoA (MazF antagonist)
VILKVTPRGHADDAVLANEGAALDHWRQTGAVPALLAVRDGGFTLLMRRLIPGRSMDESGVAWEDRLTELGRLAARLHAAGPAPSEFPTLSRYRLDWRDALADDPGLLTRLDELMRPGPGDVLVHADLHGGNALRDGDEWKAIDPHGARGDRHADIWGLLDDRGPELPHAPDAAAKVARGWVERYAGAANLEPDRAAAWTRLRGLAEARAIEGRAHSPDEAAWAHRMRRLSEALA